MSRFQVRCAQRRMPLSMALFGASALAPSPAAMRVCLRRGCSAGGALFCKRSVRGHERYAALIRCRSAFYRDKHRTWRMGPQGLRSDRAIRSHGRGMDLRRRYAASKSRITLDGLIKDQYGLPIPNIAQVKNHPNDTAMLKHTRNTVETIFRAGKPKDIAWRPPFPNSHSMGSCRMSANRMEFATGGVRRTTSRTCS